MIIKLLFFCVIGLTYTVNVSAVQPAHSSQEVLDDYQLGLFYGSPQENKLTLARKHLQKASQAGHLKAMYALGWMYYFGKGGARDYEQAKRLFQRAAKQQLPEAQHMLGVMYSEGKGVSKDQGKAYQWTVKAAKNGDKSAQAILYKLNAPKTIKREGKAPAD